MSSARIPGQTRQNGAAGTARRPDPASTARRPDLAGTARRSGSAGTARRPDPAGPVVPPVGARQVRSTGTPSPVVPDDSPGGARSARPARSAGAADTGGERPAIPAHAMPHRSPGELLALARHGLAEAAETRPDGQRYATAHLAALRAAAAVLVARARPTQARRGRPTSVWALLALVAPEMTPWADRFAAGAAKRSAAEAGILRAVTARQADDLCRDAARFVGAVELSLGLSHQPFLTARAS